jgi:hypothetical protein
MLGTFDLHLAERRVAATSIPDGDDFKRVRIAKIDNPKLPMGPEEMIRRCDEFKRVAHAGLARESS